MRIEYPISEKYISHWGVWEALREVLQNALDSDEEPSIQFVHGSLIIQNKGFFTREDLLLGVSNKGDQARGKFGEGLKLAMLVLARNDRQMIIQSGNEKFLPSIQQSNIFEQKVLVVDTFPYEVSKDTTTITVVISLQEYNDFLDKYYIGDFGIIDKPAGSVYVGGLYVCTMKNLKYAYNFEPTAVSLNRDRDIPSIYDIQFAASKYLSPEDLIDCVIEDKNDIASYNVYTTSYSKQSNKLAEAWKIKYPNTIPVGIDEQEEVVFEEDVKRKIIPDWLAKLIRPMLDYVLKFHKTPIDRLEDWISDYNHLLTVEARHDLQNIFKELRGNK